MIFLVYTQWHFFFTKFRCCANLTIPLSGWPLIWLLHLHTILIIFDWNFIPNIFSKKKISLLWFCFAINFFQFSGIYVDGEIRPCHSYMILVTLCISKSWYLVFHFNYVSYSATTKVSSRTTILKKHSIETQTYQNKSSLIWSLSYTPTNSLASERNLSEWDRI